MLNPHLSSPAEDWGIMSTDTSKDTINLLAVTTSPTPPVITANASFSQQSLSLDRCINGNEYDGLLSQHHPHQQQHVNSNHMLLSSGINQVVLSFDQCSANSIKDDGAVSHRHNQQQEQQQGTPNALLTTSSTWCQSYGIEASPTGPIQTNGDRCRENSQGGRNSMQCGRGVLDMALVGTHTTIDQPQGAKCVRARRGQATDTHSIAERHRRERIAERMKSLQELIPNANKSDKASMLDEIIDYVKFLQLQVKVLSMSRLGGAGPMVDEDGILIAERQVVKLMEDDMGLAMQFLHAKGLFLVPLSSTTFISHEKSMSYDHR